MNFFEYQTAARGSSVRMVVLFALTVLGIVLAVDLAVLLVSTVATVLVIGLGSLYRMASLRDGGEAVVPQMGATAGAVELQ